MPPASLAKTKCPSYYSAPSYPFQHLLEPIYLLVHLIDPFNFFQSSDYDLCQQDSFLKVSPSLY